MTVSKQRKMLSHSKTNRPILIKRFNCQNYGHNAPLQQISTFAVLDDNVLESHAIETFGSAIGVFL